MDDDLDANIRRALPSALKMALYAAKKQSYEILKYTIEGAGALATNATTMKEYADEDHFATLETTTKGFVQLDAQLNAYKVQLEKTEAAIESGNMDPAYYDALVDAINAKPVVNITKHDLYKRFCQAAGIGLEEEGDEEVVFQESESSRSTTCPVTQLEMEKPLRNPSCGHTYSEQGIRSHLSRSRKCPVAGCPQKLAFNSLERDVEMEVIIGRRKHSSQYSRSQHHPASAPSFRDDEDEEEEYLVD